MVLSCIVRLTVLSTSKPQRSICSTSYLCVVGIDTFRVPLCLCVCVYNIHTHVLKSGEAAVESVYVVAHLALHLVSVRASGPSINRVVAVVRQGSRVHRPPR